ncbi:MAG: NAD-dependent epimerase [Crocinitomicaceae bacterium]|nr:NAD-dependent epimerase [Crocinitomicaceae bacterium]
MLKEKKTLVIGALGQVGRELVEALQNKYGADQVVASDIREPETFNGIFEVCDVMDKDRVFAIVKKHNVGTVFNLAALLSATAEKNMALAWKLNMEGHFNVLNLAKEKHIDRIYWPSSIAVFGPNTPKQQTPQDCVMDPNTVYGISKLAGERWNVYYHQKFGVDVRSLRYPGLIGYKSLPGGGTTDYAVDIFHQALQTGKYESFLGPDTTLPMMFTEDAIRATIEITEAPEEQIKIRSSYNLAAMSFSPSELAAAIKKHIPNFEISYNPDFRQQIANSWPQSIDDQLARNDWGWNHQFDVDELVDVMLSNLRESVLPC